MPSFLLNVPVINTNSDFITRSCKPCFFSVRQMTLASAGGVTVAAALSCHACSCLEPASRNSSFSRPFRPCHCFSLVRVAFARSASCNNSDTPTRAFFNLNSMSLPSLPPSQERARANVPSSGTVSNSVATNHAQHLETSQPQYQALSYAAPRHWNLWPLQPAVQRQVPRCHHSRVY